MDDTGYILGGGGQGLKTESIVTGPFYQLDLDALHQWLDEVEIRFGEDVEFARRATIAIAVGAREAPPELKIPAAERLKHMLGAVGDPCLVVTFSDEGHKMQKVLTTIPWAAIESGITCTCHLQAGLDWTSPQGAILSILLCTAHEGTRQPGMPFRKKSVLSSRHIGINRTVPGEDFPPTFLSAQQFKELGYHPRSMAVIEMTKDDLECEQLEETAIRLYIHEDLRATLAKAGTNSKAKLAQDIIAESVINQIALVASDCVFQDGSLGKRVTDKLKKRLGETTKPAAIYGACQGAFGLVDALKKP